MRRRRKKLWITLVCAAIASSVQIGGMALAADSSTITLPYDPGSTTTLGDSIDISFPSNTLGQCVSYEVSDIVWDTEGATAAVSDYEIVTRYSQLKSETNLKLGYKTTSQIKAGIFDANSDVDIRNDILSVRDDEDTSITLIFFARADYGRRLIRNYTIKDSAQQWLDSSPTTFLTRCGTHFVRGEQRYSELAIAVHFTGLSRAGKDSLEATLKTVFGGGVKLDELSGSGSTTIEAQYKKVVEFTRRSARIHVTARAIGGAGISSVGTSATGADPASLTTLASLVTTTSATFTQGNSGITNYLLNSNTILGAPARPFDAERVRRIGELTQYLTRINQALKRYDDYRTRVPAIYGQYFETEHGTLQVLKADIVGRIQTCVAGGACEAITANVLADYVFLEDMFSSGALSLSCSYRPARSFLVSPSADAPSGPLVLESVNVVLNGVMPHRNAVDLDSLRISRLGTDFEVEDVTAGFPGLSLSEPNALGARKVVGAIFHRNLKPADLVSYNAATRAYRVQELALGQRREQVLGSVFMLEAKASDGRGVSYNAGSPHREDCPLIG